MSGVYNRNQKKSGDKLNLICFYITVPILIAFVVFVILKIFLL